MFFVGILFTKKEWASFCYLEEWAGPGYILCFVREVSCPIIHFAILLHVAVTSHMTKTTWGKENGFLDLEDIVHLWAKSSGNSSLELQGKTVKEQSLLAFSPRLPQLAFFCKTWPTAQNAMSHSGMAIAKRSLREYPTDVSIGQSGRSDSSHEILSSQVTLISVNLTRLASTLFFVTIIILRTIHLSLFYHSYYLAISCNYY